MKAGRWVAVKLWVYEGTYLRIDPMLLGSWVVVDTRQREIGLAKALTLPKAKRAAERLAETGKYDV